MNPQDEGSRGVRDDRDGPLRDRTQRITRRYLSLLRDALLDEHYLENELRVEHLLECVTAGEEPDLKKVSNPTRHMATALRRRQQERRAGRLPGAEAGSGLASDALAYASLGRVRLDHLEGCLDVIRTQGIEGDLVDCGRGVGGAGIFMRGFLAAYDLPSARVWIADRFDGRSSGQGNGAGVFQTDLSTVREAFARFELLDDRVRFLQGSPAGTLAEAEIDRIALLRIDSHDSEEVRAVLDALYERVVPGGFVVLDRYGVAECEEAVDRFRSDRGVEDPLERIDWSGAAWRRGQSERPGQAPRAEPRPGVTTKELGVVVVLHNMRREAARTLHSLSRSYQRQVDDLDYEVIVVENGSRPEERLGEDFVRTFGPEFRYLDLGDDATPSPAGAINRGIAASSGRVLALMIDGAHLLTPGILSQAMLALSVHAPAIVAVKHWYLGPGQQPEAVSGGYDEDFEDLLFAQIKWPADGYRLFEIGHFIGDRDWFDGDWESNCLFVPRELIDQIGAMDESFSVPGGGFVNLDFFERAAGSPGINVVTLLGEASFHQVHGGTTTNVGEPDELVRSYDDQYEELRGRRFQVPPRTVHYLGTMPPAALRTRARRMDRFSHFKDAHAAASEMRPDRPVPVPQDLKSQFIDAFWRSGEWHRTSWLGRWTHRPATDLFAYQELICRLTPDWIIETRSGSGGRALFCASICDLIDQGQVLSIDPHPLAQAPQHPRVTFMRADPAAETMAAQAREIVGEGSRALVILGGGSWSQVLGAFRSFAPLVPVGSYLVVEDTILGGNPVWPGFGSGPSAPIRQIVDEGEFVRDASLERFALTFNAGGFLRRVRAAASPEPGSPAG